MRVVENCHRSAQASLKTSGKAVQDPRTAFPEVFTDFAILQETYGPVSMLPTPSYFYGLEQDEEVLVDIERGKTLAVRNLGSGETDERERELTHPRAPRWGRRSNSTSVAARRGVGN